MSTKKRTSSPSRRATLRLARRITNRKISKIFEPLIIWHGSGFPEQCRNTIYEITFYLSQSKEDLTDNMKQNISLLNDFYTVFGNPLLSNLKKAKQNGKSGN